MSDHFVAYEDLVYLNNYGLYLKGLDDTVHSFRLDLNLVKGAAIYDKREPQLADVYALREAGQQLWPNRLNALRDLHTRLTEFLSALQRFLGLVTDHIMNAQARNAEVASFPPFGGAFRFPISPDAPVLNSIMDSIAYLHTRMTSLVADFVAFDGRMAELRKHVVQTVPAVVNYMNSKIAEHGGNIPAQGNYSGAERLKDAQAKVRQAEKTYTYALHSAGNVTVYAARMAELLTLSAQTLEQPQPHWKGSRLKLNLSLMEDQLEEAGELCNALKAVLKYRV